MIRKSLIILGIFWLILSLVWPAIFGFSEAPKQVSKNLKYKNSEFVPLINKVDSFLTTKKRLPTDVEFYRMYRTLTYLPTVEYYPADQFEGIPELDRIEKGPNNYILVSWRGEWNEYYTSWNNYYSVDKLHGSNGFYNFLYSLIIGGLPLLLILTLLNKRHQ